MADKFFTFGTSNVDDVMSATLSNYQSTVVDNIYTGLPAIKFMLEKGRVRETGQPGHSWVGPVRYRKNSTAAFIADRGTISLLPQDNVTQVQFRYKTLGASIEMSDAETDGNVGEERIFSLLEERTEDAEMACTDKLGVALFDSSIASTEMESFVSIIAASGTIGDQSPTGNAWWQSTVTASGSFATQGLKDLTTLNNTIGKSQTDLPDLSITTQTVYEAYEATMRGFSQFDLIRDGSIDPGVKKGGLKFKGTTTFFDENATSGVWYMINTRYLHLTVLSGANFKISPFVRPANQFTRTALIRWRGALICTNRARQGKLTGLTA